MSRRRVLITGLSGQDGGYLAEQLLDDDYEVIGAVRRPDDALVRAGLERLADAVSLVEMDLLDTASIHRAVAETEPDEIYHLAAPTFVPASQQEKARTHEEIVGGTQALLDAARELDDRVCVLLAASSEVFGAASVSPQAEDTPMRARNPYGKAKLAVHRMAAAERDRRRFVVSAITYNHESPRRPQRFVTRSVTAGVARIRAGRGVRLGLGNLDSVRDWSHARDVVDGMVRALRHREPDDYVFASGVGHTVGELVDLAFELAGVERRLPSGRDRVFRDMRYWRELEPHRMIGNATKARTVLGWEPRTTFEQLVAEMVEADLARLGA